MGADIDIISTSAIHQVCLHGLFGEKDANNLNRVPSISTSRSRSIIRRIQICQKKPSIQIHEAEALKTILKLSIQIQEKLEHETDKTQGYHMMHRHSKTQTKRKEDGEVGRSNTTQPGIIASSATWSSLMNWIRCCCFRLRFSHHHATPPPRLHFAPLGRSSITLLRPHRVPTTTSRSSSSLRRLPRLHHPSHQHWPPWYRQRFPSAFT